MSPVTESEARKVEIEGFKIQHFLDANRPASPLQAGIPCAKSRPHLPLGMNPGTPVSTTALNLTRDLIPSLISRMGFSGRVETSKFSLIRLGVFEVVRRAVPRWIAHASTTWAGVLPTRLAIAVMIDHIAVRVPRVLHVSRLEGERGVDEIEIEVVELEFLEACLEGRFDALRTMIGVPELRVAKESHRFFLYPARGFATVVDPISRAARRREPGMPVGSGINNAKNESTWSLRERKLATKTKSIPPKTTYVTPKATAISIVVACSPIRPIRPA